MENNILISIIVPIYNLEAELERCVRSIIAQTWTEIEVILVDDGSTDNSRHIIEKLASRDNRILPIYTANGGVTSARLAGVEASHGDWIGFVDGDDEIDSDMYERMLHNALKYDAAISHCGYQMCFSDGRVHYFHNTKKIREQDMTQGVTDLLEGSIVEPGLCNKLFKRILFTRLLRDHLMDLSIKINEDLLMNYYLFKQSKRSVFEDWCPYHYIVRTSSASRVRLNQNRIYDPIKVKEIILKDCEGELRIYAFRAYIRTCISTYNGLLCSGDSDYNTQIQGVRNRFIEQKGQFRFLDKRNRVLAEMICRVPAIYHLTYKGYEKFIQKKQYS